MSNLMQYVEHEQASEFYPTPRHIERMLSNIDCWSMHSILEPSAGKGDILQQMSVEEHRFRSGRVFDVDAIEIDPNLRQILRYNFPMSAKMRCCAGKEKSRSIANGIVRPAHMIKSPPSLQIELRGINVELSTIFEGGIHIVHDDLLTYNPFKQYALIVMNPPFSHGDLHLLKALKMQSDGGSIVCRLNAEAIRAPYTETRRELLRQLNEHNAIIEFIEDAFSSATGTMPSV